MIVILEKLKDERSTVRYLNLFSFLLYEFKQSKQGTNKYDEIPKKHEKNWQIARRLWISHHLFVDCVY